MLIVLIGGIVTAWNPQTRSSSLDQLVPSNPKLIVHPTSTTVSLGKANLTVDPLVHEGEFYTGDYQLKVVPYFFKSEKGKLKLEASDDTVHKLLEGVAVKFAGTATSSKEGEVKVVVGKATPSTKLRGSVTFSIVTENGPMVFNTDYHFGE
ncbi:MAG: hypothetical protein QOD99_786 [Chthoniobacter sp.]|nr:hypothetical protein [Chthoniobacter sp.]